MLGSAAGRSPASVSLTSYQLTGEQDLLLRTLLEPFAASGTWPVFGYVTAIMDEHRLDARRILASLPRVPDSSSIVGRSSYGYTTVHADSVYEDTRVGLTVAAGLVVPEVRRLVSDPFLVCLQKMIKLYRQAPASPDRGKSVWCTSEQMQAALPELTEVLSTALPTILGSEVATRRGSSSSHADGSWRREITRDVLDYEDARSLGAYVTKVCELVTEWAADYDQLLVRGAAEQPMLDQVRSSGSDQDGAKAARILTAVPLDAPWLAFLASGRPLHRVPDWLADAVDAARSRLLRDVIDFVDSELAEAHGAFLAALDALIEGFSETFPPQGVGRYDYTEIPPEWKLKQHDRYYQTLAGIEAARQAVLSKHKELMNIMNRNGQLPDSEEPPPASFQLRTGDHSPVTVYANQAHASRGGTASADANRPDPSANTPTTPWWNRSAVIWAAVGAVGTVVAAVAAVLALSK